MTTKKQEIADSSSRLSLAGRLMPTIMRLRRSNKTHRSRAHVRRHMERLTAHPESTQAPARLKKGLSVSSRYEDGWHVHTITPTKAETKGTVVYLHGDRKSTRLNSSHVAISYAVFCLKKKTSRSRSDATS